MIKVTINGKTLAVSETAEKVENIGEGKWVTYMSTSEPDILYRAEYRDYNLYSEEFIKREA